MRSDHPLQIIRETAKVAPSDLTMEFAALHPPRPGRPSIILEWLLQAMLLHAFCCIRMKRQLMERIKYDLLFR